MCGTGMRVRHVLNHFELEEVVGVGGMGTVYRALDTKLNRNIAIKVLKPEFGLDAELILKLEREARITASINHPYVVKVYSFGSAMGQYYLAMELVEKGSLDDLMSIQNRIAEMQILNVGIQIAQGLDAAYQKGLIHSDVKPGNILFADPHTAKIVDFGLAELMEEEAEKKGEIWGTPYYVSPERLNHEPEDFRSDLYSLGGTLFHALAGRPPFEAENASLVALKHVRSKAVSLQAFAPDISSETAYVINRMLQKNPEDRYESYTELVEHLTYAKTKMEQRVAAPHKKKERVVVEGDKLKTTLGWLTLAGMVFVIILVALAVMNWNTMFPPSDEELEAANASMASAAVGNVQTRFAAARELFVEGQHQAALQAFQALGESGPVQQPLKHWIRFFTGASHMALGNLKESGPIFKKMAGEDMFSMDPADRDLGNFFLETSRLLAAEGPVTRSTARMYAADDIEAFSVFMFGLKNYEIGHMEEVDPVLQLFLQAEPKAAYDWINKLKPYAKMLQTELQSLSRAAAAIDAATTPADLERAREQLEVAEKELSEKPKMQASLRRLRGRLERSLSQARPTATPPPQPTPTAAVREAEQALVARERERYEQLAAEVSMLWSEWDWAKATQAVQAFSPESKEIRASKERLLSRAQALETFKARLIDAINATKYPQPIVNKSGARLPSGELKADENGLQIQVQYGSVPAPWNTLQVSAVADMARHFREQEKDETKKVEWQWLTGVYLHQIGEQELARDLLLEASRQNAAYRDELQGIYARP